MRASVISLSLAVIIGVVIGLLLQSPNTTPTASKINNDTAQLNIANQSLLNEDNFREASDRKNNDETKIIRQQLAQEISARKKLQSSVEVLSKKLAKLETQIQPTTNISKNTLANSLPSSRTESRDWFNQQALIDAGMDTETARDLKSRYEKQELEKLYLRDQAMREGWFGSSRYRGELGKLDAQFGDLQKELGDESYAAYLFATGQSNRVTVQSVLAKSSADTAGIRTSDQILRYGNQRIYNWRDLRDATTQGDINETVSVEIIRDGRPMQVYVQRGPLGIRMSSTSLAP